MQDLRYMGIFNHGLEIGQERAQKYHAAIAQIPVLAVKVLVVNITWQGLYDKPLLGQVSFRGLPHHYFSAQMRPPKFETKV